MEFGFLFWLFFVGIIIACLQDLKRREVDNWLNLFLLVSGLVYLFFGASLSGDIYIIFHIGFILVVMFVIMNLFYYGRVFAGGDAKLLFAMTAFFIGVSFWDSMSNIGFFLLFLMFGGSLYGLIYSFVLWFQNRKKVNKKISLQFKAYKLKIKSIVFISVILMALGFVNFLFLLIGWLLFIFPFLFVFAKGLEDASMVRKVSGSELREGDWLVDDVKVGRKTIKADWDGLSLEDIEVLKEKRSVLIKEGLPFVPAFLIAFLGYVFLKSWVVGFLIR